MKNTLNSLAAFTVAVSTNCAHAPTRIVQLSSAVSIGDASRRNIEIIVAQEEKLNENLNDHRPPDVSVKCKPDIRKLEIAYPFGREDPDAYFLEIKERTIDTLLLLDYQRTQRPFTDPVFEVGSYHDGGYQVITALAVDRIGWLLAKQKSAGPWSTMNLFLPDDKTRLFLSYRDRCRGYAAVIDTAEKRFHASFAEIAQASPTFQEVSEGYHQNGCDDVQGGQPFGARK